MRFPAKKNAGSPKAPCDFPPRKDGILCPRRVVLGLPSPSHRVCADGRTSGCTDVRMYGRTDGRSRDYYVTTKISRIDRLPYFLSNGAPLAGFARGRRYDYSYLQFGRAVRKGVLSTVTTRSSLSSGEIAYDYSYLQYGRYVRKGVLSSGTTLETVSHYRHLDFEES